MAILVEMREMETQSRLSRPFLSSSCKTLMEVMNGSLKFLTPRKILPLLNLLVLPKFLQLLTSSLSCQYCSSKSFFGLK